MNQNTKRHVSLLLALCLIGVMLVALNGIPAAAQESQQKMPGQKVIGGFQLKAGPPPPGISPTVPFISATCFQAICYGIVVTNFNDTQIRTVFNLSNNQNVTVQCSEPDTTVTGRTITISPGFGFVAMSCPDSQAGALAKAADTMDLVCTNQPCSIGWVP